MNTASSQTNQSAVQNAGNWDALVELAGSVFASFLNRADTALQRGDFESAAQWISGAAGFFVRGGTFGHLGSMELESRALQIATQIPRSDWKPGLRKPARVLHVLSEAYELFGHTKLCRKWIELDAGSRVHDVVLLEQGPVIPENLRKVVQANGGKLTSLDWTQPMLVRARQLREMAFAGADIVVLHVHPDDVLPNLAFGIPAGPPVLYVNHADHAFWVGGMISDLVLDIRESGHEWTRKHRGIARGTILPIPVEEDPLLQQSPEALSAIRQEMRRNLNIPENDVVFLTIGATRKYWPMRGVSFHKPAAEILKRCPDSWLVAIGPKLTGDWEAVSRESGGRLLALGNQSNLGRYHLAADVYIEGMPAGSLTALLEAGLAGLPCVRATAQVKPPHSSDGAAFDGIPQPADAETYVTEAVKLATDAIERRKRGEQLQARAREVHCGDGWRKQLAGVLRLVPGSHSVYSSQQLRPLDPEDRDYWLEYIYRTDAAAAKITLLGTAIQQSTRRSAEARRAVERVLPAAAGNGHAHGSLELRAIESIFPELSSRAREILSSEHKPAIQLPVFTKELMYKAAEEGRRAATLALAAKMVARSPGLLRSAEFLKGVTKNVPGGDALLRLKQGAGN